MGRLCYEYYAIFESRTLLSKQQIENILLNIKKSIVDLQKKETYYNFPVKLDVENKDKITTFSVYFTDYDVIPYFDFFEITFISIKRFFPYKFKLSSKAYIDKIIPRNPGLNCYDIFVKSGYSLKKRIKIYNKY